MAPSDTTASVCVIEPHNDWRSTNWAARSLAD